MFLATRRFDLPSTDALATVQREMESLFGRVLNHAPDAERNAQSWFAPVAMWDDTDKLYVELEIPGVAKDSVDLTVHKGVLRISGERRAPEGERNYKFNDRVYGTFDRTIGLPDYVDSDSVEARLTDGVLHIELSKRVEAQPKKIALKD